MSSVLAAAARFLVLTAKYRCRSARASKQIEGPETSWPVVIDAEAARRLGDGEPEMVRALVNSKLARRDDEALDVMPVASAPADGQEAV